jgi:hypothetical protein
LWYGGELPAAPGHPFYSRLNEVLDKASVKRVAADFYHAKLTPSLAPGLYFRIMMIGFFEGIDSERGIARRLADSLTLREFLSTGLDETTPDHGAHRSAGVAREFQCEDVCTLRQLSIIEAAKTREGCCAGETFQSGRLLSKTGLQDLYSSRPLTMVSSRRC